MKTICSRCGTEVIPEEDMELSKQYPYYCPECDENLYSFECESAPENIEDCKRVLIRRLVAEEYLLLNDELIKRYDGMTEAVKLMLREGTIRKRNCAAIAIELNCK